MYLISIKKIFYQILFPQITILHKHVGYFMNKVPKNEQLRLFRKKIGLTQEQMAQELGLKRGSYAKIEVGINDLTSENIEILLLKYNFNPNWYFTGEGNMTIWDEKNKIAAEPLINYKINLPANKLYQVPVFGVAEAGYIVGYSDDWSVYVESCTLPTHSEQLTRGFTVHGSSMEYLLSDGDVILCRRVLDVKEFSFHLEEIYVLVTIDGMVVKHVSKRENGFFVRSENPGYAPFFIPYEDVIEVWRAEMKLSYMVKQK